MFLNSSSVWTLAPHKATLQMVLPAGVLDFIEINKSIGRQLHLIKLCCACIVQVSEKLFVAANMMIECHHFDLLNSCC